MRIVKKCEPRMASLYRFIPAYPEEISRMELAVLMNMSATEVAMLIGRLRANDPICEWNSMFSYISAEERTTFLNAVDKAERRENERKNEMQ